MEDAEIQMHAAAAITLCDAIRDALGAEGRPPSRRRVAAWIAAGRVRVDRAVVTDPRTKVPEGACIDLRRADEDAAAPPGSEVLPPPAILHLDRHLLVVEHEPLAVTAAGPAALEALQERLALGLEAVGVRGLVPQPVPAPEPRAGGILAAALSPAAADALEASFRAGASHLDAEAFVAAGGPGDATGLEVLGEADGALHLRLPRLASLGAARALLAGRGLELLVAPGPGRAALRPLRLRAAAAHLEHPRTGRRLALASRLPSGDHSP